MATEQGTRYPGESLGRPAEGPGSVATIWRRACGICIDWVASLIVSFAFFHADSLATLAVFWVEYVLLVGTLGSSLGHRVAGMVVCRLDGTRIGIALAALRGTLLVLVIPAIVFDSDSRAGHDVLSRSVVVRRR